MIEGMIDIVQEPALRDGVRLIGQAPYVVCPTCGKQIHFIRTVAGKQMPCEMDLVRGDCRKTLVTHDGRTVRRAGSDTFGYEPHWGYCFNNNRTVGVQHGIQ